MHSAPYDFADRDHVASVNLKLLGLDPESRILDFGAGRGALACELARRGYLVTACDIDGQKLGQLPDPCGPHPIATILLAVGARALPFRDGEFDVIVCREVLEHIPDNRAAIAELVRILKPGRDLAVSVPRFLPERICWALSEAYHREPGGHIRIYRKRELQGLLEAAGTHCVDVRYKHGLHSPYWWLKCLVGHKNESALPVNLYRKFLEWDIMRRPKWVRMVEGILNPFIAKSIIFYLKKENNNQ